MRGSLGQIKWLLPFLGVLCILVLAIPVYAAEQEVSMSASGLDPLGEPGIWCRLGQSLHINGTVLKIGYRVVRVGSPSGNIILSIYDAGTDEVLFSGVWGDASLLSTADTAGYQNVAVSPTLELNQDVRLCVEYYGGNATDYCLAGYYSGDKITGQSYVNYMCYGQWHEIGEYEEGSYYLLYTPASVPDTNGNGNGNSNVPSTKRHRQAAGNRTRRIHQVVKHQPRARPAGG